MHASCALKPSIIARQFAIKFNSRQPLGCVNVDLLRGDRLASRSGNVRSAANSKVQLQVMPFDGDQCSSWLRVAERTAGLGKTGSSSGPVAGEWPCPRRPQDGAKPACGVQDGMKMSAAREASTASPQRPADDPLVQYIILRRDLWTEQKWPLGSVTAQACHASLAACWLHKDDPDVQSYVAAENLDHMRKVVLEIKGDAELRALSETLTTAGVAHKLWVEQPEDFPTALATKPCPKSQVAAHFKKLKLCKAAIQP